MLSPCTVRALPQSSRHQGGANYNVLLLSDLVHLRKVCHDLWHKDAQHLLQPLELLHDERSLECSQREVPTYD